MVAKDNKGCNLAKTFLGDLGLQQSEIFMLCSILSANTLTKKTNIMIGPNFLLKFTSFGRLFLRIYCSETIVMINDPTHMIKFTPLFTFKHCLDFIGASNL